LADANQRETELLGFDTFEDAMRSFSGEVCDFLTTDMSGLVAWRDAVDPTGEWVILSSRPLNLGPLAPFFREADSDFAAAVDWTVNATFLAAEHGVTSANVDDVVPSDITVAPVEVWAHERLGARELASTPSRTTSTGTPIRSLLRIGQGPRRRGGIEQQRPRTCLSRLLRRQ